MQRKLIVTGDGSHSVEIPVLQVSYHSIHGAIQESLHVFIDAGLKHWLQQTGAVDECAIFEMGFGTGLNALLTLMEAEQRQRQIFYEAVEAFPLEKEMTAVLNYCDALHRPDLQPAFQLMHSCPWNTTVPVTKYFNLKKKHRELANFSTSHSFNIVYYDAFDPNVQPELWTEADFQQLYGMLTPGGILVTYSSKGSVRRAAQAAGFAVEKLPGPPGKREMLRAIRKHHANE